MYLQTKSRLLGNFRNQNSNNINQTSILFYWAFKKVLFLNFFKHSDGANCLEDLYEIFTKDQIEETEE